MAQNLGELKKVVGMIVSNRLQKDDIVGDVRAGRSGWTNMDMMEAVREGERFIFGGDGVVYW